MSADARSRAAEVLSVPVETTAGAATSAFLAGLPAMDFVPPGKSVAALNTIAGLGVPTDADDTSPTLREEVEEFARRYWSLTPADRLATWLTLTTRSPDDSTADLLLTLQVGLNLPGTPFPDSTSEHIVAVARELYVLPPRERAIRRNEWLLANAARHKELIAVAATIQKNQPVFATLDPILFARLTPQFDARLFADAATASPLPERSHGPSEPIIYPPPSPRRAKPTPPPVRHSEGWDAKAFLWILGVGLFFAVKVLGLISQSNSSTDYRYSAPDSYKTPFVPSAIPSGPTNWFTLTEVNECLEYEKSLDGVTSERKQIPPHYREWVQAGKPKAWEFTTRRQSKGSGLLQPQAGVSFSTENIRRFREYALNPGGPAPPGYHEWVDAGRPSSLP